MSRQFVNFNGNLVPAGQEIFTAANRGFRYGDGLFESMRFSKGRLLCLDLHLDRLRKGMQVLKLDNWSHIDSWFLREKAEELVRRNKHGNEARLRLTVFRDSGGLYSPTSNKMGYVLESSPLPETAYQLNERGLILDIFEELTKPVNLLSNLKTCNSLIFVMAGLFKQQAGLDEVMLLNQNGFLCESMSSNVFIVYDNKLYTPSLYEGCVAGVMRQVVMKLALENEIELIEGQINPDILNEAEEVFLTNATRGIQWVMGFKRKRYFSEMTRFIHSRLQSDTP